MRLFVVELDRFRSRGVMRWVGVVVLLGALLVGFASYHASRPPTAAQVASATEIAAQQAKDFDSQVADCKARQEEDRKTDPTADWGCDSMRPPTAQDFLPYRETFEDAGPTKLHGIWTLLLFVATALGVTFLCAEMTSGALGNWLTFEPRRTRVYAAKVAAAFVGSGILATVGVAAVTAATYYGYAINDRVHAVLPTDPPPDFVNPYAHLWDDLVAGGARTALGAAVLATVGVALGALLRHTAAALGVVVAWFAFVDGLLMGLLGWSDKSLRVAVQAWVEGSVTSWGPQEVCGPAALQTQGGLAMGVDERGCTQVAHVMTAAHAGIELGLVALVLVLVGWLVLRRRDVA